MTAWTPENVAWAFAGMVFAFYLIRSWFTPEPEEEEEPPMAYQIDPSNIDEGEILSAKLKCLEIAQAMWRQPDNNVSSATIVADATAFWKFLTETEDEADDA